ncbi:MAG: phenylalanine--tRNA ligase subunit alpha [Bacilli bacterium]|nr:phenylalanine--tRNA ligase subunit alpha [Bacilli bacterium]
MEKNPLEALEAIKKESAIAIASIKDRLSLNEVRNRFLSKKSELSAIMGMMKDIPNEMKASFGKSVNELRKYIETKVKEKEDEFALKELNEKLEKEKIDITLPGRSYERGKINPYYAIVDEISEIFLSLGFEVVEGDDITDDKFNFELLNIPEDHPARDMQDTFYISQNILLRTQTSGAQAHKMIDNSSKNELKPIKMICPGKCYRRDDDDATHSHQFGQIEGLVVDKGISLADLKGTLELFVKRLFGEKREIRLRSSYFPFTEPSVEVDVSCSHCGGKGCSMCKGTGYIEILGAGEVNPKVLEMCGYDPKIYSGFAFGVGIDRLAILKYGIDDIRRIYTNDVRFLKDFEGK